MSAAPETVRTVPAPDAAPPAAESRGDAPALARQLAARLSNEWLPRAAWSISRTGRPGLIGLALLLAATFFLFSTYFPVADEVEAMRADLAVAPSPARTRIADEGSGTASALPALPARTDVPAILRELFDKATRAQLAVDTGKFDVRTTHGSSVVRYQIAFPVTGPYPQIRAFLDSTLAAMPAVALSELALERKTIADPEVDAQIQLTLYTVGDRPATSESGRAASARDPTPGAEVAPSSTQPRTSPDAARAHPATDRVVAPRHASALFAPHSWYEPPPLSSLPALPVVPVPPPPAAEPTAPPFPYTFLGTYAPDGDRPVFFLAHGDRVIDAHLGDRFDGVYQLESATADQLVFAYLPLGIRHTLMMGAAK